MSGTLSAFYDMTKGSVFGVRNVDKTANGDIVRAGVAAGQFRNAARETVHQVQKFSKGTSGIGKKVKDLNVKLGHLSQRKSLLGYTTKAVNTASKYINPLICVSGGVKVAMADDKTSEAINQTCALGTMFGFERAAKSILTEKGRRAFTKTTLGKTTAAKKLVHWARKLDRLPFRKNMPKCAKILVPVATALGFIAMSITGYEVGSAIAGTINDARKPKKTKSVETKPAVTKENHSYGKMAEMAQMTQMAKPVSTENKINFAA